MKVKQAGTPVPNISFETKSFGSGPVTTRTMTLEEQERLGVIAPQEGKRPVGVLVPRETSKSKEKYPWLTKEFLEAEFAAGKSGSQVEREKGMRPGTISYYMKKLGVKSQYKPFGKQVAAPKDGPKDTAELGQLKEKLAKAIDDRNHYRDLVGKLEQETFVLNVEIDEHKEEIEGLKLAQKNDAAHTPSPAELEEIFAPGTLPDPVNQPNHYTAGGIETIDFIKAKLPREQFEGYCLGNVIKYLSRYRHKNGAEDLRKGLKYFNWLLEVAE